MNRAIALPQPSQDQQRRSPSRFTVLLLALPVVLLLALPVVLLV